MHYKQQLGKSSEQLALTFLKKHGYEILDTNYRSPLGEVDIVAVDKDTIVFVEVRSRTNNECGFPFESINFNKKKHIIRTALFYQKRYNLYNYNIRFDVISILQDTNSQEMEIELIRNAFDEEGY